MTLFFEIIFELLKKLYRFFGPAVFVAAVLVIEIIAVPNIADSKASAEAMHRETNEVVSFEETGYNEETMDRVFKAVLRNTGSDATVIGSLYITDESGKSIFNYVETEFETFQVAGRRAVTSYIPPGSECVVTVRIDDYKLEGIDHLYVSDLYSQNDKGKRFDIEKK
ncbi:MAG: hypothetical protein IKP47_10970 [Ruminococcus sp.]|nr:hypothetical protein [Ruminococcus sp.]